MDYSNILLVFLESLPITKSRKRPRKVLHPIATDPEIDKDISYSSPSTDTTSARPAHRARLLNPRMYI
jgi:hypothetical protein